MKPRNKVLYSTTIQHIKPKKGYYERKKEEKVLDIAFWLFVVLMAILLVIGGFVK